MLSTAHQRLGPIETRKAHIFIIKNQKNLWIYVHSAWETKHEHENIYLKNVMKIK